MIGKSIADSSSLTEKLGSKKNRGYEEIHKIIYKINKLEWNKFQQEVRAANGDEIKIKAAIDDSELQDLKRIDGLSDYAVKQSRNGEDVQSRDVNNLIQTQNHKNIASQAHGLTGVKKAIDEYNEGLKESEFDIDQFIEMVNNCNSSLGTYLTRLNGADAGLGGYARSLVLATLKTVALETVTMAAGSALSYGISLIATKVIDLIHADEQAIEASNNAKDAITNLKNEAQQSAKAAEEAGRQYAQLAQGINQIDNANVSLSTDEYETFLDLSNKLAELFPTLIRGYDDQGNAILSLGGNIDEINEKIKEQIEKKKELNSLEQYQAFMGEGTDEDGKEREEGYYSGAKIKTDKAAKNKSDTEGQLNELQNRFQIFTPSTETNKALKGIIADKNTSWEDKRNRVADFLKNNMDDLGLNSEETTKYKDVLMKKFDESDEEFNEDSLIEIRDFLEGVIYKKQQDLNGFDAGLKQQNAEISQNAQAVFERSLGYGKSNDDQKKLGDKLFRNIQWDKATTEYGNPVQNEEQAEQYIQNFADKLSKIDDTKLIDLEKLFSLNYEDMPVEEARQTVEKYLGTLAEQMGMSVEEARDLFGFGDIFELGEKYDNAVSYATDSKGFNKQDVVNIMKDNSINTEEEISKFKAALEKADTLEDAKNSYLSSTAEQTNDIPLSFSEAWEDLDTEAKDKLLELAEAGKLTVKAFEDSSIAEQFMKDTSLSAEEAAQKVNELVSSADQLSSLKTGISSISSILGEKKSNLSSEQTRDKGIAADTLIGMPEDVKAQTDEYEHFVEVMGNGSSTMEQCQEAADKLANAYLNSGNFLSNLTDKNKDYYISVLEEMGVENAAAVVTDALGNKVQILAAQKAYAKETGNKLANQSVEEINRFSEENGYSEQLKNSLYALALQKQLTNGTTLDTTSDINAIIDLVDAVGTGSYALGQLQKIRNGEMNYLPGDAVNTIADNAQKEVNKARKKLKKMTKVKAEVKPVKTPPTSGDGSGSKGNKDKSPKPTQQIDWISRRLEVLQGVIDRTSAKLNNLFSYTKKKNNINTQIKETTTLLNAQYKAANKYQTKADKYAKKSGLSKNIIKKVYEGSIKKNTINSYGEKTADKITKLQDYVDKAQKARDATDSLRKSIYDLNQQKLDLQLEHNESKRSLYDAKIKNTFTASGKNDLLNKKIDTYGSDNSAHENFVKKSKSRLKKDKNSAKSALKSSNLSKSLKNKIRSHIKKGNAIPESIMKQVAEKAGENSTLYSKLAGYNSSVDFVSDAIKDQTLAKEENKANIREAQIEQHQNLADQHQSALDRYSAEKELATTTAAKNGYINSEKAATEALYNEKIAIADLEGKTNEVMQLQAEKEKELRDLEIEQHQNLADEHQAELDLYSARKDNFNTASDKNNIVDQEKEKTRQLYAEKIAIASLEGNRTEQLKLQQELDRQMVVLEKEKFDNISQYYQKLRKLSENSYQDLSNASDELEARGMIVSASLYNDQINLNNTMKSDYEEELQLLKEQLPHIKQGTEEWYNALDSIQACKNGISQCTKENIALEKSIRDVDWKLNEKVSSRFQSINSELELARKLMSDKKLVDDGNFTKEGTATLATYYMQLQLAQKETKGFEETLSDMYQKLQNGEEGYTDQAAWDEYYDKYEAYLNLQENEYDIQQSLIGMMKDKYQAELDYLQDIINKRKELLQATKDAYDYQRTIEEKTKNVGTITKQLQALSGDDSEAAKTRIQQLKVSLDDAKKDLQDTEYNQWLNDQQTMLDNLYNEYSDFMDDKLNDTDDLLEKAISYLSGDTTQKSFTTTLKETMEGVNTKLGGGLSNILDKLGEDGTVIKAIDSVADDIIKYFKDQQKNQEIAKQNQDKANGVADQINNIGDVFTDVGAIERYDEAQAAYNALAEGGVDGEDIRSYVDSASVSTLNTTNENVRKIREQADDAKEAIAAIENLDYEDYFLKGDKDIQKALYLYNSLSESGKKLVGDKKIVLDNQLYQFKRFERREQSAVKTIKNSFKERIAPILKEEPFTDDNNHKYSEYFSKELSLNRGTSRLQELIGKVNGKYLSAEGLQELADKFDAEIRKGAFKQYLRYIGGIGDIGFSQGGIAQTLQKVPDMNGDDGWVTLKKGEAVLTPEQTTKFRKLTNNLDLLNPAIDFVKNLQSPNENALPNHSVNQSIGNIEINMDFPNVTNYEEFRQKMQSDPKIENMFKSMIYDKNSFSKYSIRM